jgi:hypothetical protein
MSESEIARDAIRALEAFGVTPKRRHLIGKLLTMWPRYGDMSVDDITAVLNHYKDGAK